MVLWEKFKKVSFVSSRIKSIAEFPALSLFPVKVIYCIAFGWKSIALTYCYQPILFFK